MLQGGGCLPSASPITLDTFWALASTPPPPYLNFRPKVHSVQTLLYWCASRTALIWIQAPGERPHMRRNVESRPKVPPVDAHERVRDYLSEAEFALLLQGTIGSRYRWRNTAMLMLTFYH